ncbi:MAG TPA: DUF2059 domain-containing protein [Acidobacteriaceae bacterium]|jgi:hypothetical protein
MKRYLAVLLIVLAVGCSTARADDASKRAKAEQLFTLLHMEWMMNQLMTGVMKQVQQITDSMPGADHATPQQQKQITAFQQRVLELVTNRIGWKALEPDFVTLYANTYTEEELDGILAFYKSPVGQKMLEKTPELMAKSTEISQQKMQALEPELEQMVQDFMKQMTAGAATQAPSAPEKKQP